MNPKDWIATHDEVSGRPSFLDELLVVSDSAHVPLDTQEAPSENWISTEVEEVPWISRPSVGDSFFSCIDPEKIDQGKQSTVPISSTPAQSNTRSVPGTTEILPWISATIEPVSTLQKTPKNPITPAQIMRIIGGLFFVALVFFGSFLAYIVFNPEQARFFISFGINPADIATLLVKLVNTIFGSLTAGLSILFMYFLFRWYITKWVPKKRVVYLLLSLMSGITLFSNIGFWAYLFNEIGASDFVRPSGGIIVYDNDLLLSDKFSKNAELGLPQLAALIWPVTLRYDLSSDARFVSKDIEIESFEIDCNGDGSIDHEGSSLNDDSIICIYDRRGSYQPRGTYIGKNTVTRDPEKKKMEFGIVKVAGVVDIKNTDTTVVFDATDLKNIWKLSWYTGDDFQTKVSSDLKFSAKIGEADQFVCLAMETNKEDVCKRVFSIASKADSPIVGAIKYEIDSENPMKYTFRVVDARSKSGWEIESYTWFLNDTDRFGKGDTVEKILTSYWNYKVSVELVDTSKNTIVITEKISIQKPLQLTKGSSDSTQLRVEDLEWNSLIRDAYDRELQAYKIGWFSVPTKMIFDASDVRVQNSWYELKEVEWKFNNDIKKGLRVEYEFIGEKRYVVDVSYAFEKIGGKESNTIVNERIIIEWKTPEIVPKMDISPIGQGDIDNLFAPVSITFDASASKVKTGTISQFIYDFGEWKEPSEWEAVKTYLYSIPGEYTVSLTVVKDDGSKSKVSRKLIVKNAPKKLSLAASISSGRVNKPVAFTTEWSIGEIATYEWDFGDGEKSSDANPNHTYSTVWKYTVQLNALYDDGVIRSEKLEFEVTE
jgi:chitodextrinase